MQGVAPTFTGGFSDNAGRRPAYMFCFVLFLGANLGLALQTNYAALMVLRALQSAGSSGTVAITYATVADIVPSAERGSYVAFMSLPSILGPSLAPVLGGIFSQYLGWRWVFWFLLITGSVYLILMLVLLPETCRIIVGNGSVPPPAANMTLLQIVQRSRDQSSAQRSHEVEGRRQWRFPNPARLVFNVFTLLLDKEASVILLSSGLQFACYSATWSGIPTQFAEIYGYSDLKIGLVFLPFAAGSIVSAATTGKLIDWNYRRHAKRSGFPLKKNRHQDLTNFPIEKARMEIAIPLFFFNGAVIIGFGWVLEFKTSIAGPLVLLFFVGYFTIAAFNATSILMADIFPGKVATATAANNLVRCSLGAAAISAIVPMIDVMGRGCKLLVYYDNA